MNRGLQRLAEARAIWAWERVMGPLVVDRTLARPDVAQDAHVLARAREWLIKQLAVPTLYDLWTGDPEPQNQTTTREVIEGHRRHRRSRRRARRDLHDRGAELDSLGRCS